MLCASQVHEASNLTDLFPQLCAAYLSFPERSGSVHWPVVAFAYFTWSMRRSRCETAVSGEADWIGDLDRFGRLGERIRKAKETSDCQGLFAMF